MPLRIVLLVNRFGNPNCYRGDREIGWENDGVKYFVYTWLLRAWELLWCQDQHDHLWLRDESKTTPKTAQRSGCMARTLGLRSSRCAVANWMTLEPPRIRLLAVWTCNFVAAYSSNRIDSGSCPAQTTQNHCSATRTPASLMCTRLVERVQNMRTFSENGKLRKQHRKHLQLPSISGHDCRSIGKLRNSIGHEALIVNLIEYKISPSCVSRSNLFGTVIVWMCECFPLKKYVSGRQIRSSIYHWTQTYCFEKF